MTTTPLSTRSLLDLLELFERSGDPIGDADGQRLHGVPGWALFGRTSLLATEIAEWMTCVGYAGYFPAACGDEHISVDLEEDDAPSRFVYRCPETFRKKFVSAAEVGVYAISPEKMLHQVADLLGIPQALRRGIAAACIDGVLWHLGKAKIGIAHIDVWFVRGLSQSAEAIFRQLNAAALPDHGLVLTAGPLLPSFVALPRQYRMAAMRDVLIEAIPEAALDREGARRMLANPAEGTLRPVLPVHFDERTSTLVIRTKPQPWVIKGQRQAAAVRYMFEQAQHDRWLLSSREILSAAYPDKAIGRSARLQNLFKGNVDWQHYIVNPTKGMYGFCLN